MTIKLFGNDIAKQIRAATKGQLRSMTLTKRAAGTRTPGQLTGGTNPTTTAYTCEGIVEEYSDHERANLGIAAGRKKVLIIAGSLPAGVKPGNQDRITVNSDAFEVVDVQADPAEATWVCEAAGISVGVG